MKKDDYLSGAPVHGAEKADAVISLASVLPIFDSLNALVYAADFDTHELLYLNRFGKDLFGGDRVGEPCFKVLQVGQDAPCSFCTNHRLVRDGVPQPTYSWDIQNTASGQWFTCLDQAVRWTDGRLVRFELAINIDEQKRNEAFRSQYVDLISHDLRAPLTVLKSMSERLSEKVEGQGLNSVATEVKLINASADRMNDMIDDLSESIKLGSGELFLSTKPTNITAFLGDVLSRILSDKESHRLSFSSVASPVTVPIDGEKLERAVANVVSNAFKYAEADTPIKVEISENQGHVEISVQNQGEGIDDEAIPRLFECGYRSAGAKKKHGLGLGLYITRQIIEAHGGRIWAESTPGETATFTFSLPIDGRP